MCYKNIYMKAMKGNKLFDYTLAGIIATMFILSIFAINSSLIYVKEELAPTLIPKQIMWYTLGIVLIIVIVRFSNSRIYSSIKIFYWIFLAMLSLLFIDKFINLPLITPVNGATAWFQLPGIGSFQPSEFMKVTLIVMVAQIIKDHNEKYQEQSFEVDLILFKEILKWCVPPMLLILFQPDTGITFIIAITIGVMVLVSGIKKEWYMYLFGVIAVFVVVFAILFITNPDIITNVFFGGNEYKLNRFYGWLYPEEYYGSHGYQLFNALMAMGSGGLFGHGAGVDMMYFPEAQTDFIFAVIAQSWGFIGGVFTIGLCLAFNLKILTIGMQSHDLRNKYLVVGFVTLLVYQQLQNIGMIMGLLPITGITLPLISYGGSSLLSYMILIGMVFFMSKENDMYFYK